MNRRLDLVISRFDFTQCSFPEERPRPVRVVKVQYAGIPRFHVAQFEPVFPGDFFKRQPVFGVLLQCFFHGVASLILSITTIRAFTFVLVIVP
jgi:hypothetical protein